MAWRVPKSDLKSDLRSCVSSRSSRVVTAGRVLPLTPRSMYPPAASSHRLALAPHHLANPCLPSPHAHHLSRSCDAFQVQYKSMRDEAAWNFMRAPGASKYTFDGSLCDVVEFTFDDSDAYEIRMRVVDAVNDNYGNWSDSSVIVRV